jgi:hypothetical protein
VRHTGFHDASAAPATISRRGNWSGFGRASTKRIVSSTRCDIDLHTTDGLGASGFARQDANYRARGGPPQSRIGHPLGLRWSAPIVQEDDYSGEPTGPAHGSSHFRILGCFRSGLSAVKN